MNRNSNSKVYSIIHLLLCLHIRSVTKRLVWGRRTSLVLKDPTVCVLTLFCIKVVPIPDCAQKKIQSFQAVSLSVYASLVERIFILYL